MKDLPTEAPEGLGLAAIPERANPGDLLLGHAGSIAPTAANPLGLAAGSVLGTSSLRRASQSLALEPTLEIKALRGNVPTRVAKLRAGGYDAILLAAAGVDRLGLDLEGLDRLDLPTDVMLPAPAQGALAIEARIDHPLFQKLARLHDSVVARAVSAERTLLQLLGGGCHLPLGCLATQDDVGLRLQAVLGEVDQSVSRAVVSRVATVAQDPETAARGCYEALRLAAPEVVGS
jgi:hydroxymethylbilane synthase